MRIKSEKDTRVLEKVPAESGADIDEAGFLYSVKCEIQPIIFRYLQAELFNNNEKIFANWLVDQSDMMEKISNVIEEHINTGKNFTFAELAVEVLERIKGHLQKVKSDIDIRGFNFFKWEEIMKRERPGWKNNN